MATAVVIEVAPLAPAPLDAAAAFHAIHLAEARAALAQGEALVLVFPPAGPEHRGWRLAAVQELAREAAPKRVNGVAGDDDGAMADALAFLDNAPGVTGQLLAVDSKSGAKR